MDQDHAAGNNHRPSHPEIGPNEVKLKEELGVGSFGKVYRGRCRGQEVAVKVLHKPILDEKHLAAFKKEVAIMSSFYHPNICLFMGACTTPGKFFIVQELMPGGDVEKLLRSGADISLVRRMVMAKDAALGMNWLHCNTPAFIHRDLKSSNLLIDDNFKVKVCDFGLSQAQENGKMSKDEDLAKGTPLWMAPEVMQFKEFNEKADVYSFGIVLWEFLTRKEPFSNHKNYSKFKKAVCGGERPPIPPDTEPSLKALIQDCWQQDANNRPAFSSIVSRLDHVIIDLAIKDPFGRTFWKKYFLGKEDVEWQKFGTSIDDFLDLPGDNQCKVEANAARMNLNLKCLQAICCTFDRPVHALGRHDHPNIVNIEHFGDLLQWFGPLQIPNDPENDMTILDNIRLIMREPWFFGDCDTARAQEKLSGRPSGTFLIRFSSQQPGLMSPQRQIVHQRIRHSPGSSYKVDDQVYGSLAELVRGRGLVLPCGGSRFLYLFPDLLTANNQAHGGYIPDGNTRNYSYGEINPH